MLGRGVETIIRLMERLNHPFCRVMYQVATPSVSPLPEKGPVLLVCNHGSLSDPLVLWATAGRPIIFLTAREVYERPHLRWMFQALEYIPLSRGTHDVGAVRATLGALRQGKVVGIFPEGGIDEYREDGGYLGAGYLAIKTGVPVVPASITWDNSRPFNLLLNLMTPGKAVVRYGTPIILPPGQGLGRERLRAATTTIMQTIRELGAPTGS